MEDARRGRIEALALAALAAAPLVPYFAHLAGHPAERFALLGDYARLELDIRHVGSGTLVGSYSRFRFAHPGPLWSFLAWPFHLLYGKTSTGLYGAACAINALTLGAIAGGVRLLTTRVHALAVTLVLLAWVAAFGDTCVLPWNPLTVVLPLLAFLVFASLLAQGAARAAPVAVLFGALALETHLSTAPTVLVIGGGAVAAYVIGVRRAKEELARRPLAIALGVLVLAFLPPLVEQLTTTPGNLTLILRFFGTRSEPYKPLGAAIANWAFATTWLPDRVANLGMLADPWEPQPMASGPVPNGASAYTVRVVVVALACFAAATWVAWKKKDRIAVATLGVGLVASLAAIASLRAVIGVDYFYLVFWTAASSTCAWVGVAFVVAQRLPKRAHVALAAVLVVGALGASAVQRGWLAKNDFVPKPNAELAQAHALLLARARAGDAIVIHADGAWHFALGMLLELDRDGIDLRVTPRDRWILGRQTPLAGENRSLHVWFDTPYEQLTIAKCLAPLATFGDLHVLASEHDVEACP